MQSVHKSEGNGGFHGSYESMYAGESGEDSMLHSLPPWNSKRVCKDAKKVDIEGTGYPVPNLVPIHTWASSKDIQEPSVSLVTHLTTDKLTDLEDQCIIWPDRVVAAIYIPMTANTSGGLPLLPGISSTTLDDMIRGIDSFHKFMEQTASCALDIVFLGQFIDVTEFPGPYPVNALRNKAMALVRTELSIHLSVDFLVAPYLGDADGYKNPEQYEKLLEMTRDRRVAYFLPVVELSNHDEDTKIARNIVRHYALGTCISCILCASRDILPLGKNFIIIISHCAGGKKIARLAVQDDVLQSYSSPIIDENSEMTLKIKLKQWARQDDHWKIQSNAHLAAEPCILLATENTPWYDERFVDDNFGANIWLQHIQSMKHTMKVYAHAFAIHIPHRRNHHSSRYLSNRYEFRRQVMEFLNVTVAAEIKGNTYRPLKRDCGNDFDPRGGKEKKKRSATSGAAPGSTQDE